MDDALLPRRRDLLPVTDKAGRALADRWLAIATDARPADQERDVQ
jgi:hypothetical protein